MTVNYWLADDFPDYSKVQTALESTQNAGLTSMMAGMMPRSSEFPGMAVKTEMSVAGQKITTTLVSVKEQEVDPAVFELPSDYKEMASPAFNLPAPAAPQP
jgi:hypothetical protein